MSLSDDEKFGAKCMIGLLAVFIVSHILVNLV